MLYLTHFNRKWCIQDEFWAFYQVHCQFYSNSEGQTWWVTWQSGGGQHGCAALLDMEIPLRPAWVTWILPQTDYKTVKRTPQTANKIRSEHPQNCAPSIQLVIFWLWRSPSISSSSEVLCGDSWKWHSLFSLSAESSWIVSSWWPGLPCFTVWLI